MFFLMSIISFYAKISFTKRTTVSAIMPMATDDVMIAMSLCDNDIYSNSREIKSMTDDSIITPAANPMLYPKALITHILPVVILKIDSPYTSPAIEEIKSPIFSVGVDGFVVTPKMQKNAGMRMIIALSIKEAWGVMRNPICPHIIPIRVKKANKAHKAPTRR